MPSMVVLATTAVPDHLRGALSRWAIEVVPGIFVGTVSARVRDELWKAVCDTVADGAALLVHPAPPSRASPCARPARAAGPRRLRRTHPHPHDAPLRQPNPAKEPQSPP
jgi:CRISPR-associated protein Cas2